jgi:hypothetical protein
VPAVHVPGKKIMKEQHSSWLRTWSPVLLAATEPAKSSMKPKHLQTFWLAALVAAQAAGAATLTVTSTADSGPGTLRAALAAAADGDTIDASGISGTILLTSGELLVTKSVTIAGPGPAIAAVDGDAATRVFHIGSNTVVTISGLTITNGLATGAYAASIGGGIYNDHGSLTVSNCNLIRNAADNGGGAIYNNAATLTLVNSTLSTNYARGYSEGGGIRGEGISVTILSSTLSGNVSSYGGGLYFLDGTLTVVNSTFSGNSSSFGGAISTQSTTVRVANSTFCGNSADYGGAILTSTSGDSVEIGNTIFKAGAKGANIEMFFGAVTSRGYNLSSDDAAGFFTAPGDQINTEPMLGPLQNKGGPTLTHALLCGSPAINQGKRDTIPALASDTDQRGQARPVQNPAVPNAPGGDGSDIGAFEAGPAQTLTVLNRNDSGPGSLRQAILDANGSPGTDLIEFAPGTYGTIRLGSGELLVTDCLTIHGPGAAQVAVDGYGISRLFHIAPGVFARISGLTITNGHASGSELSGGGILNQQGNLTLSDCVVSGNSAAPSQGGGGICNSSGTLALFNCAVRGNSATNGEGGGIQSYGTLSVANTTIADNSAGYGGGISAGLTFSLIKSTVSGNSAAYGGGIYSYATLNVADSTFSDNLAGSGGGIFNQGNSLSVASSTFSGNSAAYGASINSSGGPGYPAALQIGNSILQAGTSGANLTNSSGTVTSRGYNLSSDDGGGFLTATGDLTNANPMLGPLQDNGGPTVTHALLAGSPAIDHGKLDTIPALASNTDQRGSPRPCDNAAIPNAAGIDGTDIGAFEAQQDCAYSPLLKINVFTTADSGIGSLRHALAIAPDGYLIDASGLTGTIKLTAELPVSNNVAILGPGGTNLTISSTDNRSGAFHVTPAKAVTITGFTISHCGFGILNDCATVAVADCAITECGAGINNYGFSGPAALSVSNCAITYNSFGLNNLQATMTVNNCTISGNRGLYGGGIENRSYAGTGIVMVANSMISDNRADVGGGGIANVGNGGSARLTLLNSVINNNLARNLYGRASGGGILNDGTDGSATLSVSNCAISGNLAFPVNSYGFYGDARGGALCNYSSNGVTIMTILRSALTNNSASVSEGYSTKALGGGIYNEGSGGSATLTLADSILANNIASNRLAEPDGGGIYNNGSDTGSATLAISNCVLTGNLAVTASSGRCRGGGIFNDGSNGRATLTATDSNIGTNSAVSTSVYNCSGGGILNSVDESRLQFGGDAVVTLLRCALGGNSASNGSGGGIANQAYYGSNATLRVANCTLSGNLAYLAGGIYISPNATGTLSESTLSGNLATNGIGGGLWNQGTLLIVQSTLDGNSAYTGGGVFLSGGTLNVANSTLSGNSAEGEGGGICNYGSKLKIVNSTLSGNATRLLFGGCIANLGTLELGSTILNAGPSGGTITNYSAYGYSGSLISLGYNLSSDDGGGFLTNKTDLFSTAPMLSPLQDNGGPALTHALLCGSPAIDRGFNFSGATHDQRGAGFARSVDQLSTPNAPSGDGTDIGAFELPAGACAPVDTDGDGVPDDMDQCPNTPPGAIVDSRGCSIDQLVPCPGPLSGGTWKNHGQYVRAVIRAANDFLQAGLINRRQWAQTVRQAAHSRCGWNHRQDHENDRDWHREWDRDRDCDWGREQDGGGPERRH